MKSKFLRRMALAALAAAFLLVPLLTSAVPTYNEAYDMCARMHEDFDDVYSCETSYCEIFECEGVLAPTG